MVKIKFIGSLAHLAGAHEINVRISDEKPIGDILKEIIRNYESLKEVIILVNGIRVSDDYRVKDDDEVKVFPIISGG